MKDVFHVSKDDDPRAGRDQSVPAFTQATGEEEKDDETSRVLGTAQQNTRDRPRDAEARERGQKSGEGHREEAH